MIKTGIDSYCFHRFFGEVYDEQPDPPFSMTMEDFLDFAKSLNVDGVSLESCFFPTFEQSWFVDLKAQLDEYEFDRVYAWGHPDGLEAGHNRDAFDDMIANIPNAALIGADVMRICASSLMFRNEPHEPQLKTIVEWLKEAIPVAEEHGVKLAVENHIDYNSDEFVWLLDQVGSDYLGLNFDTGNFMRVLDDPVEGMKKLAPKVLATHIKDLKLRADAKVTDWFFFSSTPVGDGLVNNEELARLLKAADYKGFLAVEIDHLHPDYNFDEHTAVKASVQELKRIAKVVG